jgi:hypothetical protein
LNFLFYRSKSQKSAPNTLFQGRRLSPLIRVRQLCHLDQCIAPGSRPHREKAAFTALCLLHATDPEIRKNAVSKIDDHLLQKIDLLTRHGIVLHAQIVLCPGINDGQVLQRTVDELKVFHPQLKTLAIVPVGLTRHRAGLPSLHPVTPAVASKVIQWYQSRLDGWRQQFAKRFRLSRR